MDSPEKQVSYVAKSSLSYCQLRRVIEEEDSTGAFVSSKSRIAVFDDTLTSTVKIKQERDSVLHKAVKSFRVK
jgi:hypothetical protein